METARVCLLPVPHVGSRRATWRVKRRAAAGRASHWVWGTSHRDLSLRSAAGPQGRTAWLSFGRCPPGGEGGEVSPRRCDNHWKNRIIYEFLKNSFTDLLFEIYNMSLIIFPLHETHRFLLRILRKLTGGRHFLNARWKRNSQ